ncbi:MAG: hypothetical protein KC416_00605 [Myxococcales bacterium]|nr:hypothetical protein [Myxococcales bacterium]
MTTNKYSLLALILGLPTLACTADMPQGDSGACSQPGDIDCSEDIPGADGNKSDAWSYVDDPARFANNLVYRLDMLPSRGRTKQMPWASTYWPTYQDSSNVRWQGQDEMSPLEKYDLAFNGWQPASGFMDLRPLKACGDDYDKEYYEGLGPAASWMSENKGNGKMRDGVSNDDDNEDGRIDHLDEVDECGDDMDGIETWWGLCHAWVPAAILEPEPTRSVTYNGVDFAVSDMAALLITAYDSSNSLFLGSRCNAKEVERDPDTRRVQIEECRDTNAGTLHVITTNFLGLREQSFAEDRTFDYEVWNQPVVSYEITEMNEISAQEANELLDTTGFTYKYNPDAVSFREVRMKLDYITESDASTEPTTEHIARYTRSDRYHYVLELDADDKIIGGEYIGSSQENHPDFLWMPIGPGSYGSNPHVKLNEVRKLVSLANQGSGGGSDGGGTPPTAQCTGAYEDTYGRCRRPNGYYAPAICCAN